MTITQAADELKYFLENENSSVSGTALETISKYLSTHLTKHEAHWESHYISNGWQDIHLYTCSSCGHRVKDGWNFPYCPHCGAAMQSIRDDETGFVQKIF